MTTLITRDKDQIVNQIAGLDFFTIRANLQAWLQSQEQFTDYNFAGSNISALLDLLAFNTHYMGFYHNVMMSEAFLATSVQRTATVAKARELGYIPRSIRSSVAKIIINLESTAGDLPFITIPAGTRFVSSSRGSRSTYVLVRSELAYPIIVNGNRIGIYTTELDITEGALVTQSVLITTDNLNDDIVLNNQNIDTTTIGVTVSPTADSSPIPFTSFNGSETLTPATTVFFTNEIDNLQYSIHFGDGVLGQKLTTGNVVRVSYLVSVGAAGNGASTFSLASGITDARLSTNPVYPGIITVVESTGGTAIENVPSIKFTAPLSFQTQRRTVTPADYQSIIRQRFSYIKSMAVWGGETNIPVTLGYVFISVFPAAGPILLTESQKFDIEQYVAENYSVLNIRPVIVDPEYLYVRVNARLKVDPNTTVALSSLEQGVIDAILNFNDTLANFNSYFRYSKLVAAIDNTSEAITNSLANIRVERRVPINSQFAQDYAFRYFNPLKPNTFESTRFSYTAGMTNYPRAYLKDNGDGNIDLVFRDVGGVITIIAANKGTIDYETGGVTLTAIDVDQVNATSAVEIVSFSAEPVSNDVYSVRNGILVIDIQSIDVSAVADTLTPN